MPDLAMIEPTALPVGPPADVRLHVYGTGFDADSQITFGGQLERTDYHGPTELSTIISKGIFPSPDPDVPVTVRNLDGTESAAIPFAFVVIPVTPPDGTVVADLASLKAYIGARSNQDDVILQQRLDSAIEFTYERVYGDHRGHANVQEAILLLASRLYKRRQAPEGTAGFVGESSALRMLAGDPDYNDLIDRHRDWARVGIG